MAWTNIFPRIALTTYFQRYHHLISFKKAWKISFKWWHQQITLQTNTNKYKTNIQQIPHHNSDSFQNTSNISKYLQSNVCKYISNVSNLTFRQIYLFFSRYLKYLNHIKINFLQNIYQASPNRLFANCERVKLSEPRGQEVTESPQGGCLALNITILADYSRSQIQNKKKILACTELQASGTIYSFCIN